MLWSFVGIGAGIALLHILDFVMVALVTRFRYGMRLAGNVALYFMQQLPLFIAVIVATMLLPMGWSYWIVGGVCTLLSVAVTLYMFSRLVVIPASVSRFADKLLKRFRR